jgi:tight adherence protein C
MLLFAILGAAAVTATPALLWWALAGDRTAAVVSRNLSTALGGAVDVRGAVLDRSARERAIEPAIERWAGRARRFTPAGRIERMERRIVMAGTPREWTLERVLAAKLVLAITGVAFGLLLVASRPGALTALTLLVAPLLGWFAPDAILAGRADRRQQAIRLALADTLDQVTISVEAGLAFESALARTGRSSKGPLAEELLRTLQDVQAGMSRGEALKRLVERVEVDELHHFVLAIIQAESYGIPIAQVLRVQSGELRVKRRQLAEERAQKLPVKILFPLVLCILPTIFIVLLGPAALRMSEVFGT